MHKSLGAQGQGAAVGCVSLSELFGVLGSLVFLPYTGGYRYISYRVVVV